MAGVAFMVVITLLLCKFQCQVGGQHASHGSDGEIHTANTSTSPLSARELVEISLLHNSNDVDGKVFMVIPFPSDIFCLIRSGDSSSI